MVIFWWVCIYTFGVAPRPCNKKHHRKRNRSCSLPETNMTLEMALQKVPGATTPISEDAPGRGATVYTSSMTKARALKIKVLQGFNTWVCSLWLRLRMSTSMCICVVFVACSGEFGQERCCGDSELKLFIVFFSGKKPVETKVISAITWDVRYPKVSVCGRPYLNYLNSVVFQTKWVPSWILVKSAPGLGVWSSLKRPIFVSSRENAIITCKAGPLPVINGIITSINGRK